MKQILLKDISVIKGGKRIPKGETLSEIETLHPYIRVVDMNHNSIIELNKKIKYVSEKVFSNIKRYIVDSGDIILSIVGTIGVISIIGDSLHKANLTENCVKITVDKKRYLPEFVFYYLTSYLGQKQIQYGVVGSVQPKLPLYNIEKIKIPILNLTVQNEIVNKLNVFSEILSENINLIFELEEYSQLLFHKWFVDFNFPDENGNPYKDSDGEMVEVDGKMVPKGWKIKPINHYVLKTITGDWGKDEPEENLSNVRCIRGADLPSWRTGKTNTTPIRFVDVKKQSEKALVHGDVMIEISGGSPTQSTGRILNVRNSALNGVDSPVYCSNFSKIIRPKNSREGLYLGLHLQKLYNRGVFFHFESKTTGLKNLLLPKVLKNLSIVVPSSVVLEKFNEIVEPCFDKINQLGTENQLLEETRDLLIKKLIK